MSRKLTESDIQDRLEYGRRVGWDKFKFAERFGCKPSSAVQFKSKYGSRHDREIFRRTEKGKDEDEEPDRQDGYDNRPLFDLCVLTEDEYLERYQVTHKQYKNRIYRYNRMHKDCGMKIVTPEMRERWSAELERKERSAIRVKSPSDERGGG